MRKHLGDQLRKVEFQKSKRTLRIFLGFFYTKKFLKIADGVEQTKRILMKYLELRPVGVSLAFENDDTWKSRSYSDIRAKYRNRILHCWKNKCSSYEGNVPFFLPKIFSS